MKRIDSSTAKPDINGAGRDGFGEGHPGVSPPTALNASWFNSVQEELARAIEMLGVALDPDDMEQLGALLVALEGRLTAAEARTLQDSYDSSRAAGDAPMVLTDHEDPLTVKGQVTLAPLSPTGVAFVVDDGGVVRLADTGGSSVSIAAPSSVAIDYGLRLPGARNATSKAALVRAPGSGQQDTEWMPMDWGDTDGGGSGWAPNITGSGATVTEGRWSRVGNVITFSISGTATLTGSGTSYGATFTFDPPPGASDPHAQLTSADIVKGVPNFMAAFSDPASVTGTLGHDSNIGVMPWVIAGTAKA